ncbi:erythromycin esterase family protein [Chitinophaga arvensicola]|uniref:Erythromycin esterase homolog n=1 Tax=Chitinophaga arvensicola TaxID=29529 RepID=A0A1I0SDC4_9BACT|nr:erythromycin esterase family protein [Chitinophaga arvensicola]SEW55908.1 Erythromycin esterase homolog [Chitinophaga arvensicola]
MNPVPVTRLLALLLCLSLPCLSQQIPLKSITAIKSIDPADTDFSDLKGLKVAIGNARIVMLGEQTHGEGSTYLAKTRLIKYLHEQLGFEVLAFESGFYDMARIWENTRQGSPFRQEIPGSLFYMYAGSKQMIPLFDYIQSKVQQPDSLVVTGFESQHSGEKSKTQMLPDFEKFLKSRNPDLVDADWEVFKKVAVATMSSRPYRPSATEKKIFLDKLTELKKVLPSGEGSPANHFIASAGFWYRVVCSLESQAIRYWEMIPGNEMSVRDLQMAENLIWLAEKAYPGKKIIVWAHNVHNAKTTHELKTDIAGINDFFSSYTPMGATVYQHFGQAVYNIGFTGYSGSFIDFNDGKLLPLAPAAAESIEGQLAQTTYNYAFINYRKAKGWLRQTQNGMLMDYIPGKANWPEIMDGVFFIKNPTPVDR